MALPLICSSVANADVTVDAYYRADIMSNVSGGLNTGTAYLDNGALLLNADSAALFGGGRAHWLGSFLYNNGTTFSADYSGDFQTVSNIDTTHAVRVYELWYEQSWSDDHSLRFGMYDLNSEFDAISTASVFMNSSHGIGPDYSQSGQNGPSIFPVTALAARYNWRINEAATLRYALLDGVPGDPNDPGKTTIELSSDDGALNALEFNYQLQGGARLALGGWLYTADFDKIEGEDANGAALRDNGNSGFYGFVDVPLSIGGDARTVSAYLRYGVANDTFNPLDSYIGAGFVMTGLFAERPADQFGIAVASASIGAPFKRSVVDAGGTIDGGETTIELTYSATLNDWLRLQPDIQYVIDPGANPALKNALVVGLRFEMTASKRWD